MLVNCPECHSPVFVRSAAVEQRKPQRCYACKAQLLVDPDGAVEVAVSGKLAAAPPGEGNDPSAPGVSPSGAATSSDDAEHETTQVMPPQGPKAPAAQEPENDYGEATAIMPRIVSGIPSSMEAVATKVLLSPFAQASEAPEATLPAAPAPPAAAPAPPAAAVPPAAPAPPAAPPPPAAAVPPAAPASPPAPAATAPRPVTVIASLAELERAERERLAKLAAAAPAEEPAPVTLEGIQPMSVPRDASLPDLPVLESDEDLPYGDATEVEADAGLPWEPSFEPVPPSASEQSEEAAQPWFTDGTLVQEIPPDVLEAAFRTGERLKPPELRTKPDEAVAATEQEPPPEPEPSPGLPDPSVDDTQVEATAPGQRFSDRPLEELFDRSGAQLTPASLDDIPAAASVEPLSDEQPPVVAGSLIEEPPVVDVPPAPASVSAFDIDLVPVEASAVERQFLDEPEPEQPPIRWSTEEDEPYVIQPPKKRGGALGWMAALVVGAGLGLGAAYTYPAKPPLAPVDQKLADASALIKGGRPADAVPLLEEVLRDSPDHALALRRLAIASSLAGDVAAAERHYLRYLEVGTDEEDKRAVKDLLGL